MQIENRFTDCTDDKLKQLFKKFNDISRKSQDRETRERFVKLLEATYSDADVDKNQEIDRQEFEKLIRDFFSKQNIAPVQENFDHYFKMVDANGDNSISPEEFKHFVDDVNEKENLPALETEMKKRNLL